MTHRVTKICDEEFSYVYRGIEFERNPQLRGYTGHYATTWKIGGVRFASNSRKELLQTIDNYLLKKETI